MNTFSFGAVGFESFSSEFHSFGGKWVGNLCKLDFLQSFVTMLFVLVEIDFRNI